MTLETMLRNLRYRTKGRMRFPGSRSRTKFNSSRRIPPPHDLPVPNQNHISRCPGLTYWFVDRSKINKLDDCLHAGWPSLSYSLYDMRGNSHGLQLL